MAAPDPSTPATRAELRKAATRRRRWPTIVVALLVLAGLGAGGAWIGLRHSHGSEAAAARSTAGSVGSASPSTTSGPTTTTTQAPGPGFVAGKVTAVGDSVMMDYQPDLSNLVPGIDFEDEVGRQWSTGEQILSSLKAEDQLGATVIVGLATNGPITSADFDSMMSILSGASKVIFVNTHVDQPWQDPNNQVLAAGVAATPNAVLVDWNALASANPSWFGPDGTHISFGGPAPAAIAGAIAKEIGAG